jgi:hypothetical protein
MHRSAQRANARFLLLLLLTLAFALAGCGDDQIDTASLDDVPDAGEDGGAARDGSVPNIGGRAKLTVTGISPDSGPFSGGNSAVVRGSGFSDEAIVKVGGRMVQPRDTLRIDRNSLSIVLPAGDVGLADVTVIEGEEEATRQEAYTYNPLLIEPTEGSVAGGTSVVITARGATFAAGVTVEFGDAECTDIRLITPSSLRCKTPRGSIGQVDVTLRIEGQGDIPTLVARDAFEYIDFTSTTTGGLSGGPIEGTVNVTVVDAMRGVVLPDVYVLVGDDVSSPYQNFTDERGQVTFSDEGLFGPLTIHAALKCFERVSFVAFDARNVTIELTPLLDPTCAMPGDMLPGGGRGTAGSIISGELIFPGANEFWVNGWDFVPEPRENEKRVAYVYTTRSRIDVENPDPSLSDGIARIVENESPLGERGYPYRIFARPAGLAVYAIAGLERIDSGELTPYVMGVTRDLVTAPGEELPGIDIHMTLALDRMLDVDVDEVPEPTPRGPVELRVQAHLDLGGEGVIVREISGSRFDMHTSLTGGGIFPFFAQPALHEELTAASYELVAGYYTTNGDSDPPLSMTRRRGVVQASEPELVADLLAIPIAVEPAEGALLSEERLLRWSIEGDTPPDFFIVSLNAGASFAWQQLVPGSQTESVIPDLTSIPEVGDAAPGPLVWSVHAVRMPDFVFNELKLDTIVPRLFSHMSANQFTFRR